jgi:hypothetical protein
MLILWARKSRGYCKILHNLTDGMGPKGRWRMAETKTCDRKADRKVTLRLIRNL